MVWLRHLASIRRATGVEPRGVVMEIGPGDTIGVGLAALLSGMDGYVGVDAVRARGLANDLDVFDELVALFAVRAEIPGDERFSDPVAATRRAVSPERRRKIRKSVLALAEGAASDFVTYAAPYRVADFPDEGWASVVVSQATMEHVDEPESLYAAIFRWLAPGGSASFVIDYRSHGLSSRWNGHWTWPDREFQRICAHRPTRINRLPHSAHVRMLAKCGYRLDWQTRLRAPSEIDRRELSPRFRDMTSDDLETRHARIVVSKPRVAEAGPLANP